MEINPHDPYLDIRVLKVAEETGGVLLADTYRCVWYKGPFSGTVPPCGKSQPDYAIMYAPVDERISFDRYALFAEWAIEKGVELSEDWVVSAHELFCTGIDRMELRPEKLLECSVDRLSKLPENENRGRHEKGRPETSG